MSSVLPNINSKRKGSVPIYISTWNIDTQDFITIKNIDTQDIKYTKSKKQENEKSNK